MKKNGSCLQRGSLSRRGGGLPGETSAKKSFVELRQKSRSNTQLEKRLLAKVSRWEPAGQKRSSFWTLSKNGEGKKTGCLGGGVWARSAEQSYFDGAQGGKKGCSAVKTKRSGGWGRKILSEMVSLLPTGKAPWERGKERGEPQGGGKKTRR